MPPKTGKVYNLSLRHSAHYLLPLLHFCSRKKELGTKSQSRGGKNVEGDVDNGRAEANKQAAAKAARQEALQGGVLPAKGSSNAKVNRMLVMYSLAIQHKVQRNWLRPPGVSQEVKCQVTVQQSPAGDVLSVRLNRSCGSQALDLSVKNAVKRASPLPKPPDPSVFQRTIVFNFDSSGS